jgi:hypothetical protein
VKTNKSILEVEIAGGLGNQLFMFYAGLYFGQAFDKDVVYNIADFSRIAKIHPGHNLQTLGFLDNYQVTSKTISKSQLILERVRSHWAVSRLTRSIGGDKKDQEFSSKEIGYLDPNLIPLNVSKIKGYFQTWRYFSNLESKPIISSESIVNQSIWFKEKIQQAKDEKPIAIHIRKGDYLESKNRRIGVLANSYYKSLIETVDDDDRIWIFTDSPELVSKEFMSLRKGIEVIKPPLNSDPVESMVLLSKASKIMISNSTFSWWAAQISEVGTQIYAPSKWFEIDDDPQDLIPEEWIKNASQWESFR